MHILYKGTLFTLITLFFVSCGTTTRSDNTSDTPDSNTPESTPTTTAAPAPTSTPTSTPTSSSSQSTIDVLVLYDKDVESRYSNVSARVNQLFAVTNNIYSDSQLNLRVNAKQILFYDAQSHPALDEIANSANVQSLRAQYKADTVLIYQVASPDSSGELVQCGVAYGATSYAQTSHFKDAMFSQVEINCPSDTTAHELGHNMGLLHSQQQDGSNGQPYSYGLGHGVDGQFATVMAYAFIFNTTNQVQKFSSPAYDCVPGVPCGIAVGQTGEAHATKVLELTAPKIANLF